MIAIQEIIFEDLGIRSFQPVWDYQESLLQENVQRKWQARNAEAGTEQTPGTRHYFLLVEHPPVYTLGKSGSESNLLVSLEELKEKGIEYHHINRGGDITFHGPGQVVGYPILDLEKYYTDIGRYLRNLEETIILTMAEYGLKGERSAGETGVWIDPQIPGKERKICAIGIRCSRWVTMHGFAFNVNTDLQYFEQIIPCGIENKQVTTLEKELGRKVDMEEVKEKIKRNFSQVFHAQLLAVQSTAGLSE